MEPLYTAAELVEIKAYHAPVYTAALVDLVLWPVMLGLLAAFAWRWYPAHLARDTGNSVLTRLWGDASWKPSLVFALGFFLLPALIDLPFSVWFGFVREHEYGMSNESLGAFLFDMFKNQTMTLLSVSALTFGLFGVARKTKHWWWLVGLASALVLVVSTAIDPYRARLYVDQTPLGESPVRTRITELLNKADIAFADILVVHTGEKSKRVQAAFAGTGPTRTILLTDTLLASMTENEIVAAVAHEAGHVHESRWPGRILAPLAVFALLGFLEWLFRVSARRNWFAITQRADVRVLPLLVLVFDLTMQLVTPFTAARSRERELAADLYALRLTNDATSLTSLFMKLGRINKVDPEPPRWYVLSGISHPTISQRIEAIQKNATPPPMTPVNVGTSVQQAPGVMR